MVEKILSVVTAGLHPPIPLELRSDYMQATPEKQAEMRLKFAVRTLRWSRLAAGILGVLALKGLWEFGLFAFLGLGAGTARASDLEKVRTEIAQAASKAEAGRTETAAFRVEWRRGVLVSQLEAIAREKVQIETTRAEAAARGERLPTFLANRLLDLEEQRQTARAALDALDKPPHP